VLPGAPCVLLVRHVVDRCPHLRFGGLMTIGSPDTPDRDFAVRPLHLFCTGADPVCMCVWVCG
jgi:hypothetical protein